MLVLIYSMINSLVIRYGYTSIGQQNPVGWYYKKQSTVKIVTYCY